MNPEHKCVDGQIIKNETATDFEIVDCPGCKEMEQRLEETDWEYGERLRHYETKDN